MCKKLCAVLPFCFKILASTVNGGPMLSCRGRAPENVCAERCYAGPMSFEQWRTMASSVSCSAVSDQMIEKYVNYNKRVHSKY